MEALSVLLCKQTSREVKKKTRFNSVERTRLTLSGVYNNAQGECS